MSTVIPINSRQQPPAVLAEFDRLSAGVADRRNVTTLPSLDEVISRLQALHCEQLRIENLPPFEEFDEPLRQAVLRVLPGGRLAPNGMKSTTEGQLVFRAKSTSRRVGQ